MTERSLKEVFTETKELLGQFITHAATSDGNPSVSFSDDLQSSFKGDQWRWCRFEYKFDHRFDSEFEKTVSISDPLYLGWAGALKNAKSHFASHPKHVDEGTIINTLTFRIADVAIALFKLLYAINNPGSKEPNLSAFAQMARRDLVFLLEQRTLFCVEVKQNMGAQQKKAAKVMEGNSGNFFAPEFYGGLGSGTSLATPTNQKIKISFDGNASFRAGVAMIEEYDHGFLGDFHTVLVPLRVTKSPRFVQFGENILQDKDLPGKAEALLAVLFHEWKMALKIPS
ncbi:hypothetical protein DFP72DRAFT_345734 [Ephemerocybe angulata]|uniref:Uncharacterized protein n=1 Tax=Ephemerocybe angulata TaxID=980116 RepID=A0A8H6LRG4_9AGAR|nr:hypothetical protein DFP72DRAFT_345734 [Tulosesus angulatus]